MKFRYKIERVVKIEPDVLEKKIEIYLKNNFYRITERGPGYIIFTEDEFSDRQKSRSDVHKRIGDGKFSFSQSAEGTYMELIYLTSISYYLAIVIGACAFGIYTKNIVMPIVFSIFFFMPILFKIIYLNNHVFDEIIES